MPSNSAVRKFYTILMGILAMNLIGLAQVSDEPIRVDVNLVLVNVSLFDRQQRPLVDFRIKDLVVREDHVPQEIIYFGRDDLPLNLALVVDISGSVIPILARIKEAASVALKNLNSKDSVALFAFARTVRRVVDYTVNQSSILNGISSLRAGGGTSLNDALFYSALSLKNRLGKRRRVIVMISDNEGMPVNDYSEKEALNEALDAGAVFYGIRVKGSGNKWQWIIPAGILSKKILKAIRKPGDMKTFARATGGEVISADKSGDIGDAFRMLMEQVSAQHYVGYVSTNPRKDGAQRKIKVELSKEGRQRLGKVKIHHRRAYMASSP